MSRWNQLGPGWATILDEADLADEPGVDLLLALGQEAQLRAAADALALEAFQLGAYVDESEPMADAVRLAAKDAPETATTVVYGDGPYHVSVSRDADGLELVQTAGPPGLTVVAGDQWLALQPGVPARLSDTAALPAALTVLDRKGRRRTLRPTPPSQNA